MNRRSFLKCLLAFAIVPTLPKVEEPIVKWGEKTLAIGRTKDYEVLSYKGKTVYDSGLIYCPYLPMIVKKGTN